MKPLSPTLILCYVVLAVLGVGAVWDLTLSVFWGVPSFCDHMRHWNTDSNDLLASCMAATIAYLLLVWAWGPRLRQTELGYENSRDSRILFCACAFAALFMHLFLLQELHLLGIQGAYR